MTAARTAKLRRAIRALRASLDAMETELALTAPKPAKPRKAKRRAKPAAKAAPRSKTGHKRAKTKAATKRRSAR